LGRGKSENLAGRSPDFQLLAVLTLQGAGGGTSTARPAQHWIPTLFARQREWPTGASQARDQRNRTTPDPNRRATAEHLASGGFLPAIARGKPRPADVERAPCAAMRLRRAELKATTAGRMARLQANRATTGRKATESIATPDCAAMPRHGIPLRRPSP